MIFPMHHTVVLYSAAAEERPWLQLSATGFIVLVVAPMIVVGFLLWWARKPEGR